MRSPGSVRPHGRAFFIFTVLLPRMHLSDTLSQMDQDLKNAIKTLLAVRRSVLEAHYVISFEIPLAGRATLNTEHAIECIDKCLTKLLTNPAISPQVVEMCNTSPHPTNLKHK